VFGDGGAVGRRLSPVPRGPGAQGSRAWFYGSERLRTDGEQRLAALLGHVAEAPAGLGVDRPAAPAHLATVGLQHAQHDPRGGGLAGAVGADEPEHLPLGHGERQVVEGDQVAVAAGQALELQHVVPPVLVPDVMVRAAR
jgi:hypothetical protein